MPEEEFQKLNPKEQKTQWDREMDSMTEEDWNRLIAELQPPSQRVNSCVANLQL